jgi:hypothetical protein
MLEKNRSLLEVTVFISLRVSRETSAFTRLITSNSIVAKTRLFAIFYAPLGGSRMKHFLKTAQIWADFYCSNSSGFIFLNGAVTFCQPVGSGLVTTRSAG